MTANKPGDVLTLAEEMGITKQQTVWWRLFLLGMLAGAYIGIGGLLSVMLGNGLPGIAAENPVIVKLLSGAAFPVGLMLIILVGGELFTGNNATLMPATLNRRIPPYYFLLNWLTVYVANFIGAFLFVYFLVYKTGVVQAEPWLSATQKIAEHKVSLSWGNVFLRGIGANWLVCLAVWMALASQDLTGKIFAIWWPVMTFVVIGFEHSIANMFYLPLGILQGANISWQAIWLDNLLPATLGNIVGGSLLVGTMYTVLYTKKTKEKNNRKRFQQTGAKWANTPYSRSVISMVKRANGMLNRMAGRHDLASKSYPTKAPNRIKSEPKPTE